MSTASVTGFTQALANLNSTGIIGLITTIPKLITGLISLATEFGASEVAALGLNGVLDLLNINPVILALSALIAVVGIGYVAYDHFTESLEEHQKALSDAKSAYSDVTSKIDDLNSKLTDTQSKITELQGKDKLSFTDEQELEKLKTQNTELQREIDLQNQLQAAKQTDVNNEFASTMGADVEKSGEFKSSFQKTTTENSRGDPITTGASIDEMQYANEQVQVYKNAVENYKKYQTELDKARASGDKSAESDAKKQSDFYEKQSNAELEYLNQHVSDWSSEAEGVTEDEKTKPYLDFINNLKDQWAIAYNEMSGDTDAWAQSQTDAFNRVANEDDFSSLVSGAKKLGSSLDLTQDKYKDFIQALIKAGFIADNSSDSLQKVANAINDVGTSSSNASAGLSVALQSYSDLISKLSEGFDAVGKAQNELSQSGVLSYSTVASLLKIYPSFEKHLTLTKNGFVTTKAALDGLITSQIAEYQTTYDDAVSAAQTLVNSETAKQLGYKATTGSIYEQIAAMQKLAAAQLAMAGSDFINRRLSQGDTLSEASANPEYQALVSAANGRYLKVSQASNNIVAAGANLSAAKNLASSIKASTNSSSSNSAGSGSSSNSETELYIADIDKLAAAEQRLTDVQNKLSTTDVLKDLSSNSDQQIANIRKEIGLYINEQKALEELNSERRKQIQENVSKLTSQGFNVEYDTWANKFQVTNMEHINELKGKDVEATNELRKSAESLIDTTTELNKSNIEGAQDWLSAVKSIKDGYSEMQDIVSNTVDKAFDKVSKLLDKEKDAYETQKSNLESVASTVTSYINDYIDSLQAENDELDKQISLQEKLEALDKAKTQRNKKVYKSGQGFVWEADSSEVSSAQQEYDSALREYNLEAQIQDLKDYAQAWQDAVDSYENSANEALTASVLGSNWKSKVLGENSSIITDFKSEYTSALSELDDSVYGSVAYQIQNLEDLQDAWNDSKDTADGVSTDYQDILDLIQTYESGNYETRLTALSSFVTSAISQYQALAAAAASSVSYDSGTDYSQAILDADTLTQAETAAAQREAKISGEGISGVKSTSSFLDTWKSSHGYANGGVVDYTGPAMVHGATAAEMMLNNADVARVYDYIHSGDILAQTASNMLASSNVSAKTNISPDSNQNISLNIGDVNVSGVQDVNGVADEIVKKLPGAVLQKIYSKKKRR